MRLLRKLELRGHKEELSLVKLNLQGMGRRPSADVSQTFCDACCYQDSVRGGEREESLSVISVAVIGETI